jgi:hypothetical protein
LAVTDDAKSAICSSLVGLSLAVGDNLSDFTDFNLRFVMGFQFIVDLLIAVVGDTGQFFAKLCHAVEGTL